MLFVDYSRRLILMYIPISLALSLRTGKCCPILNNACGLIINLLPIFRYIALQNDENGIGPLASYFKGEVLHGRDTDIFTSNMCRFSDLLSTLLTDSIPNIL